MTNPSCFIDTGVFYAAYNENDSMYRDAALLLISSLLGWFGRVYTSSYVVDETLTLTKARIGGHPALHLLDRLTNSKAVNILRVEEREDALLKALQKFRKYVDVEGMSFTDCTTLVIKEDMKIDTLLTFDGNFKSAVQKILGEGYYGSLSSDELRIITVAGKKLGMKLPI